MRAAPEPEVAEPAYRESGPYVSKEEIRALPGTLEYLIQDWLGVPYRYGGNSVDGIDCSGFVQTIFRDFYRLTLPRSTNQQVLEGDEVDRDELQHGDLVFFRPGQKGRHVGIYLQNDVFVHASTTEGVVISSLQDEYWDRWYWTARRIAHLDH